MDLLHPGVHDGHVARVLGRSLVVGAVGSVWGADPGAPGTGPRGVTCGLRAESPPLVDRLAQLQRVRAEAAVAAPGTMAREGEYEFEWDVWAYNDATFTDEDWANIEMLNRSMKESDPLKVGRFGLGFNSVYHLTGTLLLLL